MISDEWHDTSIQEIEESGGLEIKTGPFGTQLKATDYVPTGTPVINVRNIGFGSVRNAKLEYIGSETKERLKAHLLRPNDIVFGRKGAVERHAYIKSEQNEWLQGSDCIRLRFINDNINSKFVSYSLLTEKHQKWMIQHCSHGATMASLNQDIIRRISLKLPKINTQNKIASMLSAYDDFIENNNRRIKILEEMAQMIYREWFVHFRFPGHEKVKFVDSPLGRIPESWKVESVGSICEYVSRGVTPKYEYGTGRYIINQKANKGSKIEEQHLKELHKDIQVPEAKMARIGDLLINSLGEGTIGRAHYFLGPDREWAVDQHMSICRSTYLPSTLYLYFVMNSSEGQAKIHSLKSGGTNMTTFNLSTLKSFNVLLPSRQMLEKFWQLADHLFGLKRILQKKNKVLVNTRDLLLRKLISGQVDVSDLDIPIPEEYQ
jgi:type I restriction enzyme S subunit